MLSTLEALFSKGPPFLTEWRNAPLDLISPGV